MKLTYWNNTEEDSNRRERRMAEFLVYNKVLFQDILGFIVYDEYYKDILVNEYRVEKTVKVRREDYF